MPTLRVQNFRQFYGDLEPIHFSKNVDNNVTIIYGANGAGKSALLNAFTWMLYSQTSESFENPQHIISEQAIYEAKIGDVVEARVSLKFEHNEKEYNV